jgi:hypothetical protein
MTVTARNKTPLIVPASIQRRAGFKPGDEVEFHASGGVITITPKVETAEDEYTPAQRKYIDARLAKGLEEIKRGKAVGPFHSAAELTASLQSDLKRRREEKARKKRAG